MDEVFASTTAFNQDISEWKTGKVTNMVAMFRLAGAFDQDISDWDMSSLGQYACFDFDYDTSNQWTSSEKPDLSCK